MIFVLIYIVKNSQISGSTKLFDNKKRVEDWVARSGYEIISVKYGPFCLRFKRIVKQNLKTGTTQPLSVQ